MKKEKNKHIEQLANMKAKKMHDGGMPLVGVSGYDDGGQVSPDAAQSVRDYQNLGVLDKLKMAAQGIDPWTGKPKQMYDGGEAAPQAPASSPEFVDALRKAFGTGAPEEPKEQTQEEKYEEIRRKNRQQFGG